MSDYLSRIQTCGPLPLTVVPAHRETVDSYLGRLAAANRLDRDELRAYVAADSRKTASITLAQLALVSGQPTATLARALPQLTRPDDATGGMVLTAISRSRHGCWHCQLARGHRRPARCWTLDHDVVCLRHRRWLGDGSDMTDRGQPDLRHQPEIIAANVRHRRLVRRYGLPAATVAYRDAAWICQRWHDAQIHDDDLHRLMAVFHDAGEEVAANDPTVQAARYPQIIDLARLLGSPYWRAKADQPEPIEFIAEVRRTVAPRYVWSLANPHRHYDPLVQCLGHHQRQPGGIAELFDEAGSGSVPRADR